MKFKPSVNLWNLSSEERAKLQPGQWVYAGVKEDKGIYLGQKPSGSDVVAWYRNAKGRVSFRQYINDLRQYAKG